MKINRESYARIIVRLLNSLITGPTGCGSAPAATIQLRCRETIRLERNSGIQSVDAISGMLWLTGTPASRDVLLSPGEIFELRNDWPFVIEALEPSEVSTHGAIEV